MPWSSLGQENELVVGREKQLGQNDNMMGSCMESNTHHHLALMGSIYHASVIDKCWLGAQARAHSAYAVGFPSRSRAEFIPRGCNAAASRDDITRSIRIPITHSLAKKRGASMPPSKV